MRNWLLRRWARSNQLHRSVALRGPPVSFMRSSNGDCFTLQSSIFRLDSETQYWSRNCQCLWLNVTEGERDRKLEGLLENVIEYVTKWSRVFREKLIIVLLQLIKPESPTLGPTSRNFCYAFYLSPHFSAILFVYLFSASKIPVIEICLYVFIVFLLFLIFGYGFLVPSPHIHLLDRYPPSLPSTHYFIIITLCIVIEVSSINASKLL